MPRSRHDSHKTNSFRSSRTASRDILWARAGEILATVDGQILYHLLADVSDTNLFKKIWHATSIDGINWKWQVEAAGIGSGVESLSDPVSHTVEHVAVPKSFLESSIGNVQLLNPVALSTGALQDGAQWWGFLNYVEAGLFKVGRFLVDWNGATPTIRIVTSVDSSGNYFFTNAVNGDLSFLPFAFLEKTSIKSLFFDSTAGTFQIWGGLQGDPWSAENVNCDTTNIIQCTLPTMCMNSVGVTIAGCPTDGGRGCVPFGQTANAYELNTMGSNVGSNLAWWEVAGRFSMDTKPHQVYSKSRFIPTGYATGRFHPFRWNSASGKRYLFSATNDAKICSNFLLNQFWLSYTVLTEVNFHEGIFDDGFQTGNTSGWSIACPPDCS